MRAARPKRESSLCSSSPRSIQLIGGVITKIQRIAGILVAAVALVPLGACDRSESTENVPVIEEESGSLKLPSAFENLKVLPKDISKNELKKHMKGITKSLGVKCSYCHRTDIRDYASDEIREKVIARDMMRMLERLDLEVFTWKGAPKPSCFMCHHGESEPQLAPAGRKFAWDDANR
jgi:hypothetical protein